MSRLLLPYDLLVDFLGDNVIRCFYIPSKWESHRLYMYSRGEHNKIVRLEIKIYFSRINGLTASIDFNVENILHSDAIKESDDFLEFTPRQWRHLVVRQFRNASNEDLIHLQKVFNFIELIEYDHKENGSDSDRKGIYLLPTDIK